MAVIYLAGGCFWGAEKFFSQIHGVIATEVGYANGSTDETTYEAVCTGSGHAETVRVEYDEKSLPLSFLLSLFYEAINPVSVNRQGGDAGIQYRTGIYYVDDKDRPVIVASIERSRLPRKAFPAARADASRRLIATASIAASRSIAERAQASPSGVSCSWKLRPSRACGRRAMSRRLSRRLIMPVMPPEVTGT